MEEILKSIFSIFQFKMFSKFILGKFIVKAHI